MKIKFCGGIAYKCDERDTASCHRDLKNILRKEISKRGGFFMEEYGTDGVISDFTNKETFEWSPKRKKHI